MVENYSEQPLLGLESRSEEDWSVPGFIDPHHVCLFTGHAIEAYESCISCDNISQSFGPLRFKYAAASICLAHIITLSSFVHALVRKWGIHFAHTFFIPSSYG